MEKKLEDRLKRFCEDAKKALGSKLKSVVVYGSCVSGEYISKRSNVNLLVIVDRADFEALKLSYKLFQKYKNFTKVMPLLFDKDYIERSSDVFPIEFLDMKENYLVLYGEDALRDLKVERTNLRLQCESELKGKFLRLRQAYLEASFTRDLKNTLVASLPSFIAIFRNLIRLKGTQPPLKKEDVIKELCRLYNLNEEIPQSILMVKTGKEKVSHKGIAFLYRDWLAELEKLTRAVDELKS